MGISSFLATTTSPSSPLTSPGAGVSPFQPLPLLFHAVTPAAHHWLRADSASVTLNIQAFFSATYQPFPSFCNIVRRLGHSFFNSQEEVGSHRPLFHSCPSPRGFFPAPAKKGVYFLQSGLRMSCCLHWSPAPPFPGGRVLLCKSGMAHHLMPHQGGKTPADQEVPPPPRRHASRSHA